MQNNMDPMNKTKEIPEIKGGAVSAKEDITADQQSLFDAEDAFSESMVVEKQDVEIGDTAEFDIPENKPVDVKELQDSARDYYDATHSESIEDKVNELCRFADEEFAVEAPEFKDEEPNEEAVEEKKKFSLFGKGKKKKKRKNYISDDDMDMLSESSPEETLNEAEASDEESVYEAEEEAVSEAQEPETFADDTESSEYVNPLSSEEEDDGDDEEKSEDEKEEARLIKAFGETGETYTTFDAVFGSDVPEEEYTDKNQDEGVIKHLRKNAILSMISVILTLAATVFCVYFEAAAGTKLPHPVIFEAGKYGVTYAMSMLQLLFLCVLFNLGGMKRAFKGLRPGRAAVDSFCAVTVIVCTLHSILSAAIISNGHELKSFCSIGCIAVLFLSVNSFIKSYTALISFCIISSKAPKISSVNIGMDSEEAAVFKRYFDDDTTIFTAGKSSFIKGFFAKQFAVPRAGRKSTKLILWTLVAAIFSALVCGILSGLYNGICAFTTVCLAALPANALISTALPFFVATIRAKKTGTTYIGEAACDMYESTGVVSFSDTEVFPAKNVKVSSIRTYGDNRIDKVILYMAKVFEKLEGPLSYVFANSLQNSGDSTVECQIAERFADGINAKIDGKDVLVGTGEFMKLYNIETPIDNIDESFTRSLGSIVYMAVDGGLASKLYIKYTMSRGFENILRAFYDAGICVGIRTLDPSITTELVCGNLKGTNYPVSVIKNYASDEADGDLSQEECETDGAIVSLSGVGNFLRSFIRLDNLRNVYRSNTVITTFSVIVGIVLAILMNVTGISVLGTAFIAAFQLVWCIPTVMFSLISK